MNTIDYQKQGTDFLKDTNTKMIVKFLKHGKHFADEKETRDIFKITLVRQGKRQYSFNFGQSLAESTGKGKNKPSAYDVLACLTKYEVGSFENFASEFGYDEKKLSEYPRVLKIYKAVKNEYNNVNRLFNDVMEQLSEIQ